LTHVPPLRVAAEVCAGIVATRQPVGALAVVLDAHGRVLLGEHLTRPSEPWGLPGGWLEKGEMPEAGLRRELREELGLDVDVDAYLGSFLHYRGRLRPRGVTLAFAAHLRAGAEAQPATWEIARTRWVTLDEALALPVTPDTRTIIERALAAG